jgi:phenylacetic acid degradation operon negative regulatory protein
MTAAPSFDTCLSALTGERPRVWSLIVTVFGDLAFREGDRVSTQVLARITEPIGIKPEALRVALHRLRKDGWIDSQRVGRGSTYHLTAHGSRQTHAAAPRIYGRTNPAGQEWALITAGPGESEGQSALDVLVANHPMIRISATSAVGACAAGAFAPTNLLVGRVDISRAPAWLQNLACPEDTCEAYANLLEMLRHVERALPDDLTALETATLRVLIVHSWRRVLLRHPDLPDTLFPVGCPAIACRNLTMDLLNRLPRPHLSAL